ncbi:MAG: Hpt domain-containing protein [Bdellovibrionales bacterium]|nr:Hpt domain-containing protein [Bdellovibrionales bacterium]
MNFTTDKDEVREMLRKRYLDRLSGRLRKMRRDLVARNWSQLKDDCKQLAQNAESFGFPELREIAERTTKSIPDQTLSRANLPLESRRLLENLLNSIDGIIATYAFPRRDQ